MKKDRFISPTSGEVKVNEMVAEVAKFVRKEPGEYYNLIIGTDSQAHTDNGKSKTVFVSAIIVHRKTKGGRYFWKKETVDRKMVLREKIYKETTISLELAESIVPQLRKAITPAKYDLEIHIDVGPLGPTREMIKEVVGMVTGSGYNAKTKPESWGASSVADKYT